MQMRVCGAALSSVLQSHPVPSLHSILALSASQHGLQAWLKRAQECPVVFWVVSCGLLAVISESFGNPRFQWKAGFSLLWPFMETVPRYLPPNVCHHGSLQHPVLRILLYSQEISWWLLMFLLSCQQSWLLWVRAAWGVKLEASRCYLGINLQHLKATQSIVYSLLEPGQGCKYTLSEARGSSEFIFSSFCRWESQGAEDHLHFIHRKFMSVEPWGCVWNAWVWPKNPPKKSLHVVKKVMPSIEKADWD